MAWIAIPVDFRAQIPIVDFLWFGTTTNGFRITRILNQTISPSLKEATSRLGVEASTMPVLPSMTLHLLMSITRTTLVRGLRCRVYIWLGEALIGDTVSRLTD